MRDLANLSDAATLFGSISTILAGIILTSIRISNNALRRDSKTFSDRLSERLSGRFTSLDKRMDGFEKRIDSLENRFNQLDLKLDIALYRNFDAWSQRRAVGSEDSWRKV